MTDRIDLDEGWLDAGSNTGKREADTVGGGPLALDERLPAVVVDRRPPASPAD